MSTKVRTKRVGGSLMVILPADVVDKERIREGEFVEIAVWKPKRSFFGISKGIGKFTPEDEAEMEAHND